MEVEISWPWKGGSHGGQSLNLDGRGVHDALFLQGAKDGLGKFHLLQEKPPKITHQVYCIDFEGVKGWKLKGEGIRMMTFMWDTVLPHLKGLDGWGDIFPVNENMPLLPHPFMSALRSFSDVVWRLPAEQGRGEKREGRGEGGEGREEEGKREEKEEERGIRMTQ